MATPSPTNQYLATRVLTARPEELRMMLLDGALKFARQGREGLVARNYESCFNGFSRCRDILFELLSTMKPAPNPELVQRLGALYGYMISRLLQASTERDLAKADEVIGLIEYECETWRLVMDKHAQEQRAAASAAAQAADAARTPASPLPAPVAPGDPVAPSFSFQG
ncbi:MAG: flagellar export chaperone FliS [Phycisphaerae bacterium]|nr:flagellar export chaperone FliS [Phycisphaerae bacterium]